MKRTEHGIEYEGTPEEIYQLENLFKRTLTPQISTIVKRKYTKKAKKKYTYKCFTAEETLKIKHLYKKGSSVSQIAKNLKQSKKRIKMKVYTMNKYGLM